MKTYYLTLSGHPQFRVRLEKVEINDYKQIYKVVDLVKKTLTHLNGGESYSEIEYLYLENQNDKEIVDVWQFDFVNSKKTNAYLGMGELIVCE